MEPDLLIYVRGDATPREVWLELSSGSQVGVWLGHKCLGWVFEGAEMRNDVFQILERRVDLVGYVINHPWMKLGWSYDSEGRRVDG